MIRVYGGWETYASCINSDLYFMKMFVISISVYYGNSLKLCMLAYHMEMWISFWHVNKKGIKAYSLAKSFDWSSPLTLGGVSYNFVILCAAICWRFVSYIPYNDIIFSQSAQGIHFTSCQNMYTVYWKTKYVPKKYLAFFSLQNLLDAARSTIFVWSWKSA